jgi:cellulose biosynthesis protein BcsQ
MSRPVYVSASRKKRGGSLDRRLGGEKQRETILARCLPDQSQYDAIVIDTSPAMNPLTCNALLFAEELVIPVGMDLMAVIGARQTFNGILQVRELWPQRRFELLAVLPTLSTGETMRRARRSKLWSAIRRSASMCFSRASGSASISTTRPPAIRRSGNMAAQPGRR